MMCFRVHEAAKDTLFELRQVEASLFICSKYTDLYRLLAHLMHARFC